MKKFTIFLVVALLCGIILIVGGNSNSIVGKWQDNHDIVEFKSDGKFTAQSYWLGGSYTVSGNKLSLSPAMENMQEFTYEINKDGHLILKRINSKYTTQYDFKKIK